MRYSSDRGFHLLSSVTGSKKHFLLEVMVVGTLVCVLTCPLSLVTVCTEMMFPDLLTSVCSLMVETSPCELVATSVTIVCPSMTLLFWVMTLCPPLLVVE